MRKSLLFVAFFFYTASAIADMQIVTIDLHNRSAQEVIEIIRPMLQQGGSLTGAGYKLIIKSTPQNIEQIKTLLTEIDTAPAQLLVSVTMNRQTVMDELHASHSVTVKAGDGRIVVGGSDKHSDGAQIQINNNKIKYDARIFETRKKHSSPTVQQVRVTEGLWASIGTGQSIPIATRQRNADGTVTETITYQQITSGFLVLPRINGDNVSLTISPRQQSVSQQGGGAFDSTGMETTVTGKLNQWIQLGGVTHQSVSSQSGINYGTRIRDADQNQIWVKVERAK